MFLFRRVSVTVSCPNCTAARNRQSLFGVWISDEIFPFMFDTRRLELINSSWRVNKKFTVIEVGILDLILKGLFICWKLLSIWLVGRFFSFVKITVWPITGRRRKSSLSFTKKNNKSWRRLWALQARRYSFSRGIYRRTRKWCTRTENWAEYCSAEGVFGHKRRLESCRRNSLRLIHYILRWERKKVTIDYEPSSIASFERYLKRKFKFQVSIHVHPCHPWQQTTGNSFSP